MTTEDKVTRRGYVKYAGAGIIVVAGAAAGAYYASRPASPGVTTTETSATSAGPKYGGVINNGMGTKSFSLDPALAGNEGEYGVIFTAYERLLRYDENMALQPELAERWEASPDGTEYTFYIRKGVKFHNGKELTADDVRYTFDRLNEMKEQSVAGLFFAKLDHTELIDDYTVKIVNSEPWAPFLNAMPLHSASILPRLPTGEEVDFNTAVIGTGPFQMTDRVQGQYEKFDKFGDYWVQGIPYVDTLWFRRVVDDTARAMSFESKQFDSQEGFSSKDAQRLMTNPDLTFVQKQSQTWSCLEFQVNAQSRIFAPDPAKGEKINSDRPRKLRLAMNYAINREEIARVVYEQFASATYTGFPPEYLGYYSPPGFEQDINKAKQLLTEAGYPDGLKGVKLCTYPDFHFPEQAELLQTQVAQAGIQMDIEVQEVNTFVQTMGEGTADITLDCNVLKLDPALSIAPYPEWVLNYKPGMDPAYDQIAKDCYTIMDSAQRAEALKKLQSYLFFENAWFIAIVYWDYLAAWWNTLHGVKVSNPTFQLKFEETWKE